MKKDIKKLLRLRQSREKNYNEIGKICTEIQYYYVFNEHHPKLVYLQNALKRLLETNVKLTMLINDLERE